MLKTKFQKLYREKKMTLKMHERKMCFGKIAISETNIVFLLENKICGNICGN